MPCRARVSILRVPWYIVQRGNNRAVCFYAIQDYHFFLLYLIEFAKQLGCAVHAYVLITNPYAAIAHAGTGEAE